MALFLLLRRRHRRRHQNHPPQNAETPFILPPDPAVVQGSHESHTFLFGKEAKTLPPHLSGTVTTGTVTTTIAPSTHTQSQDVESLSHRHMDPSTSSSIVVASTSAFGVQANSDKRGVVSVTDKVETRSRPGPLPDSDAQQGLLPPESTQATQPTHRVPPNELQ